MEWCRSFAIPLAALALCLGPGPLLRPARAHEDVHERIAAVSARIERAPLKAALYFERGELHRAAGEWPAAEHDCLRARDLDPSFTAADLCLGLALLEQGVPRKALAPLNRFLRARPGHAEALAARARARAALGDREGAAEDFTRAIKASGGAARPDEYLKRARLLAALGPARRAGAIRGLDEGLARLGEPVALQLLAIDLELRAGRTYSALTRLDRIAARSPRKETWLARRGEILEHAGRGREAMDSYWNALTAIESLAPARRSTPAMARLEAEIRAALGRLRPPAPSREARAP